MCALLYKVNHYAALTGQVCLADADWPRVKFAAFGYSTSSRLDEDDYLMGMWSNMAPEVLRGSDRMYDRTKVDMWSCGECSI